MPESASLRAARLLLLPGMQKGSIALGVPTLQVEGGEVVLVCFLELCY